MDNQLDYYTETGKLRDEFDQGLPIMATYTTFRKRVYQDGALVAPTSGTFTLTTKDEVLEAVSVAVVMGGTAVSAETWRVVKVLQELGKW